MHNYRLSLLFLQINVFLISFKLIFRLQKLLLQIFPLLHHRQGPELIMNSLRVINYVLIVAVFHVLFHFQSLLAQKSLIFIENLLQIQRRNG